MNSVFFKKCHLNFKTFTNVKFKRLRREEMILKTQTQKVPTRVLTRVLLSQTKEVGDFLDSSNLFQTVHLRVMYF